MPTLDIVFNQIIMLPLEMLGYNLCDVRHLRVPEKTRQLVPIPFDNVPAVLKYADRQKHYLASE